jgi:hypothetical protein
MPLVSWRKKNKSHQYNKSLEPFSIIAERSLSKFSLYRQVKSWES